MKYSEEKKRERRRRREEKKKRRENICEEEINVEMKMKIMKENM